MSTHSFPYTPFSKGCSVFGQPPPPISENFLFSEALSDLLQTTAEEKLQITVGVLHEGKIFIHFLA